MGTPNLASTNKSNGLAVISPKLASKSPSEIALRQWFVTFAELKREEFSKIFIDVWCEALNDLDPELIEFACRTYFRWMKFFPMPGDIREIAEAEKEKRLAETHRQEELKRNEEYLQQRAKWERADASNAGSKLENMANAIATGSQHRGIRRYRDSE